MLLNIVYAIALVFATVFVHTLCTIAALAWFRPLSARLTSHALARAATIAALVLLLSFAALLEAGVWAAFYYAIGALPTFPDALYFSLVTFTTLGYGDIVLDQAWRVLSAFEAANGIILFGWTTAIIVAAVQRVFVKREGEAGAA